MRYVQFDMHVARVHMKWLAHSHSVDAAGTSFRLTMAHYQGLCLYCALLNEHPSEWTFKIDPP